MGRSQVSITDLDFQVLQVAPGVDAVPPPPGTPPPWMAKRPPGLHPLLRAFLCLGPRPRCVPAFRSAGSVHSRGSEPSRLLRPDGGTPRSSLSGLLRRSVSRSASLRPAAPDRAGPGRRITAIALGSSGPPLNWADGSRQPRWPTRRRWSRPGADPGRQNHPGTSSSPDRPPRPRLLGALKGRIGTGIAAFGDGDESIQSIQLSRIVTFMRQLPA